MKEDIIGVKTRKFEAFLEKQRQPKYSSWVLLEPIDSPFKEVRIVITSKNEPLDMRIYLKEYSWKNEIDKSLDFATDYSEVKDFLWKNRVRKVRHIATIK